METMMTINETAKHYGVSVNTIYRRLQSGLLMGNKVGNKWWINVGSTNDSTVKGVTQDGNHANVTDDGNHGNGADGGALVDQMQARIDSLETQLTTRAGEIDQLHRLLAQTALNAAPTRPWWAFWR